MWLIDFKFENLLAIFISILLIELDSLLLVVFYWFNRFKPYHLLRNWNAIVYLVQYLTHRKLFLKLACNAQP